MKDIKLMDTVCAVLVIVLISGLLFLYPEETAHRIDALRNGIMQIFTPYFLVIGLLIFLFCLAISLSKWGKFRIGSERPEYKTSTWLMMIFCTGMGSNLLYWSGVEWIHYYTSPPAGIEPLSSAAEQVAAAYGPFHWGLIGWAIYAVGAITLGFRCFVLKRPGFTLSGCCDSMLHGKNMTHMIEIFYLFGTIGGYATMVAFVVPMYCNNLTYLFNLPNTFISELVLMGIITVIFTVSSCSGVKHGIKRLSQVNVALAIILGIFFLYAGASMGSLQTTADSVRNTILHFTEMSLAFGSWGDIQFAQGWTGFYWAWWIGLAPSMWIFISKISKGRTVRQILMGTILSGTAGCLFYFGAVGNYGLCLQKSGAVDLVEVFLQQGPDAAVLELVLSLPHGRGMLILWTLTGLIFLITTLDSGTYTLAVSTSNHLMGDEQPNISLRLFWAVLIIAIPAGLIYADSPVSTLQAAAIITSLPISILTILTIVCGIQYLRRHNTCGNQLYGKNSKTPEK